MRVVVGNTLEFHSEDIGSNPIARSIPKIKMKVPENFVEVDLGDIPESYVGYLYLFTNLDNAMLYLGIHMGYVQDGYWHSSQNKEFKDVFQNSSTRFRFEILEYSSNWAYLNNKEHTMLQEVDAVNNPQYYNKSNGRPMYKVPRLKRCEKLVEDILSRVKFPITIEPIENHFKMEFIQARLEDEAEIQNDVKNLIDDAGGSTKKCNPVVVYEDRMFKGKLQDVRGDGTQTVNAANRAKHATELPIMRIPKKYHEDFTELELEGIGNLLNPKDEIRKSPVKVNDGIKFVKRSYYSEDVPYDDPEIFNWLEAKGFHKKEISKIIEKAGHEIETERQLKEYGRYFRNYAASPYKGQLANSVKQNITADQICLQMSSKKFNFDRLADLAYVDDRSKNPNKKRIKVLVYHPTVGQSKKWKTDIQPYQLNKAEWYLNEKGYEVEFEEQEMWEETVSIN